MTNFRSHVFVLLLSMLPNSIRYACANNDTPVIDLGYAKYQGEFDSARNVTNYLGVRYAAPPTGDLRWRAPQTPIVNSSVVQLANEQPPACLQAPEGTSNTNPLDKRANSIDESEDCLFINVYIPGDAITKSLPTLIWIHGGGYIEGNAASFTGSDVMREAHNEIILVIIQYRLGIFGFLPGSEVKKNGDLNAGLLDQDFALRWVQTHISKFGGDPSKVTIWGESAGMLSAGSVLQHIVAHDGETSPQLFRGAITSSTYLPPQYFYNDTIPESLFSEVVSQASCSSANDSLTCLRGVNVTTLESINTRLNVEGFFGTFVFVPVVDGTFIKQRPTEVLKQQKVNGKALLSITNSNEGNIFVNQTDPITNVSLYAGTLFPTFGSQQAQEIAQLYKDLGTPLQQDNLIMGECVRKQWLEGEHLITDFRSLARLIHADSFGQGEFASSASFTAVPPATHGSDLVYYWTSQGTPAFNNTAFLDAFQEIFMAFVISQDPNDKTAPTLTPHWNLYSQGETEMVFNRTVNGQPDVRVNSTDQSLLERCNSSLTMKTTLLVFALLPSAVISLSAPLHGRTLNNNTSVVDLGYARYRGVFDSVNNLTNFLGIRYAAPPTGDLRWRAPQTPAQKSSVVQLADTQPLPCFQAVTGAAPTNPLEARASAPGNPIEDCLFLNVYYPGDTVPVEPLPTLVWIHGGGYIMGGADQYPGSDLMREADNKIVLVIIQYRLGLFGFLAGSKVKQNGDLNAGLREDCSCYDLIPCMIIDHKNPVDQDFALRWVQTHTLRQISKFGGDPSKVTIWGESAGAGSVLQHIVAQDGQTNPQLFRGAITSSTFLPSQYIFNDSIPEMLYSEVVSQTECSSAADSLACLREVDAAVLGVLNNNINADGFFGTFLFVPVVDGTFITQRPTEALKQGRVNGKALLSITNSNEGNIFVNALSPITNVSLYASTLFPKFGWQQANETAELYANLGTPLQQDQLIMAIFICPTYYLMEAFGNDAWKGEFAVPPATHGADVEYYFPSIGVPPFPNPNFLAAFQGGFLSFVVSQNPNDKIDATITPSWDLYSNGNTEMIFNRTAGYQPDIHADNTDTSLLQRCNFWNNLGAFTGFQPKQCTTLYEAVMHDQMITFWVQLFVLSRRSCIARVERRPNFLNGQQDKDSVRRTQGAPETTRSHKVNLTFVGLSLLVSGACPAHATATYSRSTNGSVPVIDLGYAQYQGAFDSTNNLTNYLGMRYAAPPLGNLRWQAPQSPASNDSGIQQATTQPLTCPQADWGSASSYPTQLTKRAVTDTDDGASEDCLYLNYLGGSASMYSGADILRDANNEIVVVIIQYRLGIYGFLPGSEVKANGSLNAGILDQEFALRWVHSHISKFGGDPSKVTIWGESAGSILMVLAFQNTEVDDSIFPGAGSVFLHTIANGGETQPQLFRGAITSSTFFPSMYFYNDTIPEALFSQAVSLANCSSNEDPMACLRALSYDDLQNINLIINAEGLYGTFILPPVIDDNLFTQRPIEALKQGKVNGEALLSVTNANEGYIFINQSNPMNASTYATNLFPELKSQVAIETNKLYASFNSTVQDILIMGDSIFVCPTYYLLSAFRGKAWKYLTPAIPPATHGSDVPYYYPSLSNLSADPIFENTDFFNAFSGAFMAFIVSQNPNDKLNQTSTPFWAPYSINKTEMIFNKTADDQVDIHVNTTSDYLLERCRFWESIGTMTAQ
ncbi:Alpha/Beta hydrolase protein [Lentinula raphanica]|nr:Alpha/Beta hydrolase protein [Lentinula raphanica]